MNRRKEKEDEPTDARRQLPAVSALLEQKPVRELVRKYTRTVVLDATRQVLDDLRKNTKEVPPPLAVLEAIQKRIEAMERDRLRPVVNATGVVLHTNLGRAVLPREAVDALSGLGGCCNLQIDLATGARGKRNYVTEQLVSRLTGAEAAMIVNNNAAATFLVLSALCAGREVVISRGQLIEIGGSFRLPDCISQSGATMVEVGTTNKTHLRDYENALTEKTGALLRVNPSNYRVVGFSKEVPVDELVEVRERTSGKDGMPPFLVIDDLGCGALIDLQQFGLPTEPTVQHSIASGADVVLFSGDKLIGGPQAGIIAGRKNVIDRIKKHPLTRMLRVGKMTDLVLEQTLRLFLDPETLVQKNPTLRMLALKGEELKAAAELLAARIRQLAPWMGVEISEGESAVGGGSLPATALPTWLVLLASKEHSANQLLSKLRANEPPVIARIENDKVAIDVRTLLEGEAELVAKAVSQTREN